MMMSGQIAQIMMSGQIAQMMMSGQQAVPVIEMMSRHTADCTHDGF